MREDEIKKKFLDMQAQEDSDKDASDSEKEGEYGDEMKGHSKHHEN